MKIEALKLLLKKYELQYIKINKYINCNKKKFFMRNI